MNAYIAVTAFLRKYNLSHIKFALLADFAIASCILGAHLRTFVDTEPSWIEWSSIGWKWKGAGELLRSCSWCPGMLP